MKLEIETFEEDGVKYVWIGEENGSGVKRKYADDVALVRIISNVIKDKVIEEEIANGGYVK